MPFVLDASTALSLVLEDEKALFTSTSEWTLALMAKDSAIVPPIFWSEIGNALVVNRRLDHQQMLAYFSQLQRLPITVVSQASMQNLWKRPNVKTLRLFNPWLVWHKWPQGHVAVVKSHDQRNEGYEMVGIW